MVGRGRGGRGGGHIDLTLFSLYIYGVVRVLFPLLNSTNVEAEEEDMLDRECRWFARLLLEGKIAEPFRRLTAGSSTGKTKEKSKSFGLYTDDDSDDDDDGGGVSSSNASGGGGGCLNDPPALITHRRPVRKVLEILQPLLDSKIISLASLNSKWRQDPTFLKAAVKMWIKAEYVGGVFKEVWKEVITEAAAAGSTDGEREGEESVHSTTEGSSSGAQGKKKKKVT